MRKVPAFITIFATVTFLLTALWAQASQTYSAAHHGKRPKSTSTPANLANTSSTNSQFIYTSRTSDSGLLTTGHQMVFGPLICTRNGDPYSPFNSPFRPPGYPPGSYTYQYRILIPPTYPHNSLRVELFDPDSHNSATNAAIVTHTNYAVVNGFPAFENRDCINDGQGLGSGSRYNACLLVTGEENLLSLPTVTVDQINPVWFMRTDENRTPAPGFCSVPVIYTESYNTTTVYQLFYLAQSQDSPMQQVPLANYTGLKNNAHNTDLYWVSPGGTPSSDNVFVPVDAGSPRTFELNLDTDVPNIISEAGSGNRHIYLNVATTDGSAKNGFDIWAGPAIYTNSVPSQVNARNVHLLDNPNSHDSAGIVILASGDLPYSAHYGQVAERPLGYFGPEYAGRTISLTLFDVDVGSQAPLTFTFDTITPTNWSLTFGISGTIDPDGVPANSRCFPDCNDQFITPSYAITIPGGPNCNPPDCTPFPGSRLLIHYLAGINDNHLVSLSLPAPNVTIIGPVTGTLGLSNNPTFMAHADFITTALPITYTWQADAQLPVTHTGGLSDTVTFRWPVPHTYTIAVTATNGISTVTDTHQIAIYPAPPIPGCASFPIALEEGARSVLPPGTGSGNDYPAPSDFHPSSPQPLYLQFPNNMPDVPLGQAQAGYIFKLNNGTGSGDMAWLVWNNGINPSSNTLANSLTVPGDSTDYTNIGNGSVTPFYPFMVRGYVNPFDTTDLVMQPNDWVTVNTGSVNSAEVRDRINDHSLNGRELRLPVWDAIQVQGGNVYVRMVQFAIFRLHGHNLSQGGVPSWLLVEFVRWETRVCTEGNYPVGQVHISGPVTGTTNADYDFAATVVPTMTNQPITYTWSATEQTDITHTSGLTDTAVFQWLTPGTKTITVTAANDLSIVTATHLITISQPVLEPIAGISLTGPITGLVDVDYDFTAVITPTTANQPITYTWQATAQDSITHTGGISDMVTFSWNISGTKLITITADNGLNEPVTAVHTLTIETIIIDEWRLYLPFIKVTFGSTSRQATSWPAGIGRR